MGFIEKILKLLKRFFNGEDGVYYIGGSESLPPPLSPSDEAKYIRIYDGTQEDIRQILIEHNLRLVVYIARKFESTGINLEDLISIGTIGLIKAVNTYRSDKNTKLATYASRCIENEILMYLRRTSNSRTEISIDEPLTTDGEGGELSLSDVLGTEPDSVSRPLEDMTDREILHASLETLSPREREIICMRYGLDGSDGLTQKEVAEKLGISQSYISRLEKKIIIRLRRDMQKVM
ncbi:MAG: RNA polymerase sporulation sigma factor SigK [Clostridia bacterium]|nr:RNA polymerase sporulation sigma factor SigK [Clostridia bacterium]